jgi:methyl-accepting chemotaxis protein
MSEISLHQRTEFFGIDPRDPAFKGVSRALSARLDTTMDAFYSMIRQRPDLAAYFENTGQMDAAKSKQAEHWKSVFRDGLDGRFEERALKIGAVHARIGLQPHWYIGAYAMVLDELVTEIIAPGWQRYLPWKRAMARQVTALLKVSLIDIDLALSAYFEKTKEEGRTIINGRMGTALDMLARGNLTASVAGFPEEYSKVEHDFNAAVSTLNETMGHVVSGVQSITTGSAEIRSASNDLARRTEEQASNLARTAAAIAETSQRVTQAAQSAASARSTIELANNKANDGSAIVAQAVNAMDQIEKSSQEINNIIAVIDSIAFQTNLLALNAGVEAARAGETGKGFAVVASEVRALARRCTEAADEVKTLISASSSHVASGVDLVSRSGEAFKAITLSVSELASSIETIASSSQIQAESLAQINGVVGDLDRSTQQNAAMAEQCTAAAASLAGEAERLGETVSRFELAGFSVGGEWGGYAAAGALAA